MKKLLFTKKSPLDFINEKSVMNFLNLESVWHYKNNELYRKLISQKHNINFPDGRSVSLMVRSKRTIGPIFTRKFLTSELTNGKKHFFIGDADIIELSVLTGINTKNLFSYNPPYIKELEFNIGERKRMATMLKKFNPDYIWVCIGGPKQEILANQLFDLHRSTYFNVGSALDFLTNKKSEAPRIFRGIGLEWLYRGVTDFKHSRKKILRSLIGLRYLNTIIRL